MEKQLAEYRARKEKEKKAQQSIINSVFGIFKRTDANKEDKDEDKKKILPKTKTNVSHIQSGEIIYHETEEEIAESSKWKIFTLQNGLIFLLWMVLWKVFIMLEFGAVYFLATGFMFLYFNTRTESRGNKLSAYSVFNPNFERLEGTLTAEQFERQLLQRPPKVDD